MEEVRRKKSRVIYIAQTIDVSLIVTVYNEADSIQEFLDSILAQSSRPQEVVIVDAGSSDTTTEILDQNIPAFKKIGIQLRVIKQKPIDRARGRNIAIKNAAGDIILGTDAGCTFQRNWVKNITKPFQDPKIDVVSGFYRPYSETGASVFQLCLAVYTSVIPDKLDAASFLPSSRSIAFRKSAWEAVGGYPEGLYSAEDLVFARLLKQKGLKFTLASDAIVYWPQRTNLLQAFKQFFQYALGDGQVFYIRRNTWYLFTRYIGVIFVLAFAGFKLGLPEMILFLIVLLAYLAWTIKKNYRYVKHWKGLFYLPALQFVADFAVIFGMLVGMITSLIGMTAGLTGMLISTFSKLFTSSPSSATSIIVNNTGYQVIGRLFTALLGLVTTSLLARYLGPIRFGEFFYAFSVSTLVFMFADLGLDTYLIRETAHSFSMKAVNKVLSVRIMMMSAIFLILSSVTFLFSFSHDVKLGIIISSVSSMALLISNVLWSVYRGKMHFSKMVIAQIVTTVIILLGTALGVKNHASMSFFFITHAFGFLGGLVFSLARWERPYNMFTLVSRDIRSLLRGLEPFIAMFLFATLYFKIDMILLGYFHPPQTSTAVGLYAFAYKPFEIALVTGGYFTQTLLPYFSTHNLEKAKTFFRLSLFLAFVVSLGLFFLAPVYISLVGGVEFISARVPLQILALAAGITILSGYFGSVLLAQHKEKKIVYISAIALVVNIVGNVLFTPSFSYEATSWMTVITQLVVLIGYVLI